MCCPNIVQTNELPFICVQVFDLRQCHLQMQSLATSAQKAAQMQAAAVAGVSGLAVGAPRSK